MIYKRPNLHKVCYLYFCFKDLKHPWNSNFQSENTFGSVGSHFLTLSCLNMKISLNPLPFSCFSIDSEPNVKVVTTIYRHYLKSKALNYNKITWIQIYTNPLLFLYIYARWWCEMIHVVVIFLLVIYKI